MTDVPFMGKCGSLLPGLTRGFREILTAQATLYFIWVRISSGSGTAVSKYKYITRVMVLLSCAVLRCGAAGQEPEPPLKHFSFEMGLKFSTLGAGIDVAVPLIYHSNLRIGFNAFNYGPDERLDGILYSGQIGFRSVQATYDWFPFGGAFHLSPGLLVYNGNQVTAKASVPSAC